MKPAPPVTTIRNETQNSALHEPAPASSGPGWVRLAPVRRCVTQTAMQRAPLVLPAAAFLLGIVAQAHGLSVPFAFVCVAAAFLRRDAAMGAAFGLLIGCLHGHPWIVEKELHTARYYGTVVGDVRTEDGAVLFPLAIAGFGTLRASSRENVAAGERITVRARISPIDEARNPYEPSPRTMAIDDGLSGQIAIERILRRAPADPHDVRIWPTIARERAARIIRAALPEPAATVLAGALWGERGTLPQDVRDDFQATGTVHVLVTAGLHLGVIATLIGAGLALLAIPRVAAALGTIPVVYGYAWLSGWHLPSQRAAAMIAIALLARACGARAVSLNTLALAAMVVAASWPVAVESVSFALSFSCVASIVLFAEPIAGWFVKRRVPELVAEALALTISTQIGVWPLTAAVFFTVAPYAIAANAIVVPLVGATMILGIATLIAHPLVALSSVFARWDLWLLELILQTTHAIAALPGARLTMTPPPLWSIVVYDLLVVGAAVALRLRPALAAITVAGACAAVAIAANVRPSQPFSITMLDVGQGDSIVVRTPRGHTILVDAGGRLERGATIDGRSPAERSAERIVIPYLRRAGITRVDLLILTHPHGDHVGGCLGIVTQFRVGAIFDSGQSYDGRAYTDCKRAAAERHVPILIVHRGLHWSTDDVSLDILAPTDSPLVDTGDDVNENSIVARLTYTRNGGSLRALFMGDAGVARESELINHRIDLRADFLKVGHHGSRYASSPAFIDAVMPRSAAISVGRHNLFGHPAQSTIETLQREGVSSFRTDQCGAVTIAPGNAGEVDVATMLHCANAPASRPAGFFGR
jgi:competence protein ComEC